MISLDTITTLSVFLDECTKLESSLRKTAKELKRMDSYPDDPGIQRSMVIAACVGSVVAATMDPTNDTNKQELDDIIDPDKLMEIIQDKGKMRDSFEKLDAGYTNKHKQIFDIATKINEHATMDNEKYVKYITTKDESINSIINDYLEVLTPLFDKDKDGPINSSIGLIIFAITSIRKSIYKFGIDYNPNGKELTEILKLASI